MADQLQLRGVAQPPFSHFDLTIPKKSWLTVRGQLATGKATLIAHVVYGECQRRFLATLPPYWQQQLTVPPAPDLEGMTGAMPALLWQGGAKEHLAAIKLDEKPLVADALGWRGAWRNILASHGSWQCPLHKVPVTEQASLTLPADSQGRFAALCLPSITGADLTPELIAACQKLGVMRVYSGGRLQAISDPLAAGDQGLLVADIVAIKSAAQLSASCEQALGIWSALLSALASIAPASRLASLGHAVTLLEAFPDMTAAPFVPPLAATAAGHCPEPDCDFAIALVPDSGEDFTWAGASYSVLAARRFVSLGRPLGYENGLALTVAAAGELLRGLDEGCLPARQLEAAATLGLGPLSLAAPLASLSAGQRQRLALCSASLTAANDILLLLFYPSAHLDESGVEALVPRLKQLRARGNSLIVVDNHPRLASAAQQVLTLTAPPKGRGQPRGEWSLSWQEALPSPPALEPCSPGQVAAKAKDCYLADHPLPQLPQLPLLLSGTLGIMGANGSGKTRLINALSDQLKAAAAENARDTPALRVFTPKAAPQSFTTVASLLGIWQPLRAIYARLPEAKALGITAKGFLSAEYRCPVCLGGDAHERADCPACLGSGLSHLVSGIRYRELSLSQFLSQTITAAQPIVSRVPLLAGPLAIAAALPGLGELALATPVARLSKGTVLLLQLAGFLADGPRHKRVILAIESGDFSRLHPCDREALHRAVTAIAKDQGRGLLFTCTEPQPYHAADLWLALSPPFMPLSCQFFCHKSNL